MPDRAMRNALHYAALNNDVAEIQRLIGSGESVDASDSLGFTPLHFAAQERNVEAVRALIQAGASIDAQNVYGNGPLSVATYYSQGDGDIITLLLAAGADMHLANNYGQTPIGLAGMIANFDARVHFPSDDGAGEQPLA